MIENFEDRRISVTVTDEWIHSMIDTQDSEIEDLFSDHILWFERNYNAVAEMKQPRGSRNYKIQAIAAADADTDEIRRGVRGILAKCEKEHGPVF